MVDVTIASTDVSVIGGPSAVTVDVNFGPKGTRGSYIYNVLGIPGSAGVTVPSDLQIYDIAINIDTSSVEYLSMYQYFTDQNGQVRWNKSVSLKDLVITGAVRINDAIAFSSGTGTLTLPLFGFVSSNELSSLDFNIQHSIENANPVASSVEYSTFRQNDQDFLIITIHAAERSGSTWSNISATKTVHLNIAAVSKSS